MGSQFELRLPVEVKQSLGPGPRLLPLLESLDLKTLRGKRALVVDDAPENQMLIRLFLTKEGMQVETANDGEEAVRKAMNQDYDIVLMDMQMPVMNGYEAVRILRERGFAKPVVAFTASAMKGDEDRCFNVGCNAFVPKPVKRNELLGTLADLV